MFKAVPYNADEHYTVAVQWWKQHGWKNAPEQWELAPNGIVVIYDDKPIAMTWIYRTDGMAAWLNWIVTDRYVSKEIKDYAIKHLIDSCELLVKGWGFKQLWTTARVPTVIKRFQSRKWRVADSRMTNLVKELY